MNGRVRIFIGYDAREAVVYHACCQSILDCTDADVSFHPVRGTRRDGSNAFTYARFLVPRLCGFQGWALYLDGDMVVRADVAELWDLQRSHVGACVVQHDYRTKFPTKYLGAPNRDYPRKNWSSVVLWNCGYWPNRVLTPECVGTAAGEWLHRFSWLRDDEIGSLPHAWNRLVLEEPLHDDDKLRHFTVGAPCFAEYADCDGAGEWHATLRRALAPLAR